MTPPPGDTQEDDIDPLPIIIQPVYPVPAFSLNGIEDEATDPAGETTSLDNASVPESEQTQAERESVISTGTRDTLISRGNLLRAQAIAEDKERDRVEMEYKRAVSEGRKKDAILLEGELDKASERAKTLHERAARRYFRGTRYPSVVVEAI